MNCGIFVVARLGSQRLPAKHLQPINGAPILVQLIRRLRHGLADHLAQNRARIVVVTSDEPANRELERAVGAEAEVFYGSIHNIPLRELQAAEALDCRQIVSVDGDDILCSPAGVRGVAERLAAGAPYVQTAGLPFGMNSFGYTREFLAAALARQPEGTLETGWGRIFRGHTAAVESFSRLPQDERLRFTLDYPEDLEFFREVFAALGSRAVSADDENIIGTVLARGLHTHNAKVAAEYWVNFRRQVANESGASPSSS